MTDRIRTRRLVAGGLLLSLAAAAAPAGALAKHGGGDAIRKTVDCSAASTATLKVKIRDGRIEAEGEVDQNRNGKSWDWRFKRDGNSFAHGSSVTKAPSGSFSVERSTPNAAGSDIIVFRASNPRSGEECRVSITI